MDNPLGDRNAFVEASAPVAAPSAVPGPADPADLSMKSVQFLRASPALCAFVCALLYMVFWQISLVVPSVDIIVVWAATIFSLMFVLVFTVLVARSLLTPKAIALNTLASGLLALPLVLVPILVRVVPRWPIWNLMSFPLQYYFHTVNSFAGLHGLILIWFAAAIGACIARLVREFKMLLPMAAALALVDIYVVFGGGLVTQANAGHSPVATAAMRALTVALPTTGPHGGAAPMQLSVGFADFLFTSLFFACFARFGISSRRTFFVLFATLVAYMFLVFFRNLDLPALVPIAVVVVGMNLRRFQFARSELFAMLYAGLLVLGIIGFMKWIAR